MHRHIHPFSGAVAANMCPGCHSTVGNLHAPCCRFGPGVVGQPVRTAAVLPMRVRHKKTGNIYLFLGEVLDCTNARDGTRAALYLREGDPGAPTFVRELREFWEKFEPVEPTACL